MIKLDINIGDTILVGRFKNKRIEVKEIGVDEHGGPTVNGRNILKIRIEKLMKTKKNLKEAIDYNDDVIKAKDLKSGNHYVWIMGAAPLMVTYLGHTSKGYEFQFDDIDPEQKHGMRRGRQVIGPYDVQEYIKIPHTMGESKQFKLANIAKKILNEAIGPEYKLVGTKLEIIGPNEDELLDATNILSDIKSEFAFKYYKLAPIDQSGVSISDNKFSMEVEIRKGKYHEFMGTNINPYPDLPLYIREANTFLKSNGFKCKLYKNT